MGLVGDAKAALLDLLAALGPARDSRGDTTFVEEIDRRKREWLAQVEIKSGATSQPMTMARAVREIQRATPDDAIVVTGAGLPQGMVKQRWVTRFPRTHLTSGGFSTMGFTLPAAIGAQLAQPERQVLAICGDGDFLQSMQELQAAVLAGTPVCVVVLDNSGWISIKGGQETFFGRTHGPTSSRRTGRSTPRISPRSRAHSASTPTTLSTRPKSSPPSAAPWPRAVRRSSTSTSIAISPSPVRTRPAGGTPRAPPMTRSAMRAGRPASPKSSSDDRVAPPAPDLRLRLRRPGDALPGARIGTVPILWNNVDVEELRLGTTATTILDEIARLGYEGTQLGLGFPEGSQLRAVLSSRGLRLAEVYAALPATPAGMADDALAMGRERLRLLDAGGGDVLCVALDGSPDRDERAGRAFEDGTPRFTDGAWQGLADVLHALADETIASGHRLAFHPHAGTYVETPAEVERLVGTTDPAKVGICLDVGHCLVGGGDPVAALRQHGQRVTHVHLKDVDPIVLEQLRDGAIASFGSAVRARLFTELSAGALDLLACLRVLAARDYDGWLMVEQDSSWPPPSEAAAIGRRVLAQALAIVGAESAPPRP